MPARRIDLLQDAVLQQRDSVAHGHRFDLVVGDVDRRGAQPVLELGDLGAHLDAELGVEIAERLVHQEDRRLTHDGAAHGDALALAARELAGATLEIGLELEDACRFDDARPDLGLGHPRDLQRKGDVVEDRHVRIERVVLEHHRDVAVLGMHVVDELVADPDAAVGDLLEPGDHAQRRRLAAARRPDEHEELAVVRRRASAR